MRQVIAVPLEALPGPVPPDSAFERFMLSCGVAFYEFAPIFLRKASSDMTRVP